MSGIHRDPFRGSMQQNEYELQKLCYPIHGLRDIENIQNSPRRTSSARSDLPQVLAIRKDSSLNVLRPLALGLTKDSTSGISTSGHPDSGQVVLLGGNNEPNSLARFNRVSLPVPLSFAPTSQDVSLTCTTNHPAYSDHPNTVQVAITPDVDLSLIDPVLLEYDARVAASMAEGKERAASSNRASSMMATGPDLFSYFIVDPDQMIQDLPASNTDGVLLTADLFHLPSSDATINVDASSSPARPANRQLAGRTRTHAQMEGGEEMRDLQKQSNRTEEAKENQLSHINSDNARIRSIKRLLVARSQRIRVMFQHRNASGQAACMSAFREGARADTILYQRDRADKDEHDFHNNIRRAAAIYENLHKDVIEAEAAAAKEFTNSSKASAEADFAALFPFSISDS